MSDLPPPVEREPGCDDEPILDGHGGPVDPIWIEAAVDLRAQAARGVVAAPRHRPNGTPPRLPAATIAALRAGTLDAAQRAEVHRVYVYGHDREIALERLVPADVVDAVIAAAAAHVADVGAAPGTAAPPEPISTVRLADLADPGRVRYLIDRLWTSGAFGIIGAEPKSWKSYLILYLSICVASGRRAFGRFSVEQGRVLMFAAEGGTTSLRRRAGELCRALDVPIPPDLHVIDLPALRLDDPATVARVIATVEQVRPVLLVLDPLRELHAADENDAGAIAALLGPLRTLQRSGCAVAVVHHMSKAPTVQRDTRRGGQRLRGSSALHGATDSALYLATTGSGATKRVTVEAEHRDAAEADPFTIAMRRADASDGEAVWLEIVEDGDGADDRDAERDLAAATASRAKIERLIRLAAMPGRDPLRSKRAIAAAAHMRPKSVGEIVDQLIEEGAIRVDEEGAFRPAEGGRDG